MTRRKPLSAADLQPFLDNPESLALQAGDLQLAIANHATTPRHLLDVLIRSSDPQVAEAARLHVNWAEEITQNWREAAEAAVQNAQLGQNDRLAVELLKFAPVPDCFLSEWVPASPLIEGLQNPYLPWRYQLKLLERLADEPTLEPRLQVAESPRSPLPLLEHLAGDLNIPIRLAVKNNPSCPPQLIELMEGQYAVAANWNSDVEELAKLGESRWDWIRLAVAQNPNTPAETLMKLAADSLLKIQFAVVKNPHTPETVLAVLAAHPDREMQAAVAEHPNATEEILLQLLPVCESIIIQRQNLPARVLERLFNQAIAQGPLDPYSSLFHLLLSQPNTPETILAHIAECDFEALRSKLREKPNEAASERVLEIKVLEATNYMVDVAKHPNVTVSILERLAQYPHPQIQLVVAQNPKTSEELKNFLLEELTIDSNERLQIQIAADPNTPLPILQQMAELEGLYGDKRSVAVALIGNPKTPTLLRNRLKNELLKPSSSGKSSKKSALHVLLALAYNQAVPEAERKEYFQQLLSIPGWYVAEKLAQHPNTPHEILALLMAKPGLGRQAIAKNPNAPAIFLAELAHDGNSTTRHWAAENPGTPAEILTELAREADKSTSDAVSLASQAALKNPSLPRLERYRLGLEKEREREKAEAHQVMLRRPNRPYALQEVLKSSDFKALYNAACNSMTPVHILEQLAKHPDEKVRWGLINNPNLPIAIRLELTRDPSVNVRCGLARKNPYRQTPTQVLERLADDELKIIRELVAENSDTPVEILVKLANDSTPEVKAKVAGNHNTPIAVLERLGLEEGIFSVRNPNTPGSVLERAVSQMSGKQLAALLKHPVTGSQMPASTLEKLANHTNPSVRYRVAYHPNTAANVLDKLSRDVYVPTVRAVASHVNTLPHVLERLATHPDYTTRYNVAQNPNTSATALERLARYKESETNAPSVTKDGLKSMMAGADNNQICIMIARNLRTPLAVLEMLATREFFTEQTERQADLLFPPRTVEEVLESLIYNPRLTPEILVCLASDPSPKIRSMLVRHSNLTSELWEQLATDEDASVRGAIASQPTCPISILETLARDRAEDIRTNVAANPNTPTSTLEFLSQDPLAKVRQAIAANPNTQLTILERLAQDEKVEVRRRVAKNPNAPSPIRESLRDLLVPTFPRQSSPTLRGLSRIYNPNTDDLPTLLSEYVQSPTPFVRFVALLHPLTPASTLIEGSQSLFWRERYAVADNPSTSVEIRQQLAQDSNCIVRVAARANLSS